MSYIGFQAVGKFADILAEASINGEEFEFTMTWKAAYDSVRVAYRRPTGRGIFSLEVYFRLYADGFVGGDPEKLAREFLEEARGK